MPVSATPIVFPATLPTPSLSTVTPVERRRSSDISGPSQTRISQWDYLATQQVRWDLLTPAEAAIMEEWWRVGLHYGGSWFTSTWPAPQGWTELVRRVVGVPKWTHLPGGFWKVESTVQVRGKGVSPNERVDDPLVLLLHFDEINGSTTPVDSSRYAHAVTSYDGAIVSSAQSKFGGGSGYTFGGSPTPRFTIADTPNFVCGTGDFTFECWYYRTSNGGDFIYNGNAGFTLGINFSFQYLSFSLPGGGSGGAGGATPLNTWRHAAAVRKLGVWNIYNHGVSVWTNSSGPSTPVNMTGNTTIGYGTYQGLFPGYLDEVAIYNGWAKYTGNFTPSEAPIVNPSVGFI